MRAGGQSFERNEVLSRLLSLSTLMPPLIEGILSAVADIFTSESGRPFRSLDRRVQEARPRPSSISNVYMGTMHVVFNRWAGLERPSGAVA